MMKIPAKTILKTDTKSIFKIIPPVDFVFFNKIRACVRHLNKEETRSAGEGH